jgi:hypothetical protein
LDVDDILSPSAPDARALTTIADSLAATVATVRQSLADAPTFQLRLEEASPAQRYEIVRLRQMLVELREPINARIAALDMHARRVYATTNADQLPVEGTGNIVIEPPANEYVVKEHELRAALLDLAEAGLITKAEVDAAITEQVSYKADHRKLNYLAKHRGDEVKDVIDAYRARVKPDPYRAKVRWPEAK